jgi:hypothetical protein
MKKVPSHFIGGVFLCSNAADHPADSWVRYSISFLHQTLGNHIEYLNHMMVLVQDREKEVCDPVHKQGVLEVAKRPLKAVETMITGLEKPIDLTGKEKSKNGTRIIFGIGDLKYCMAVLHLAATSTAGKPTDWMHLMRSLLDKKHGDVVWWNSRHSADLYKGNMGEMFLGATVSFQKHASR